MLNGGGSDTDGTVVNYQWKEGATVLGSISSLTHSFAVGTHTVTLTVTDNGGATASDIAVVTVAANQPPTANGGPNQSVVDNDDSGAETVTLNGSGSDIDGTVVNYQWKEGATVLGSNSSLTHSFGVGTHTVTLTVTDNGEATATAAVTVTVDAPNPLIGEGLKLSKNAGFSTEDTIFSFGETMYILVWSDRFDFNDVEEARWQLEGAEQTFTNNLGGAFTDQVVIGDNVKQLDPGKVVESDFTVQMEDGSGYQFEMEVNITIVGPTSTGSSESD